MFVQIYADIEGIHKLAILMNEGCPKPLTTKAPPICPKDLLEKGDKKSCQKCWERYLLRTCKIVPKDSISGTEIFDEKKV